MPIETVRKVIEVLKNEVNLSPSKIAEMIGSDRRTINKVLEETAKMGMVDWKEVEISGRKYRSCSLTPNFRKILENRKKKGKRAE